MLLVFDRLLNSVAFLLRLKKKDGPLDGLIHSLTITGNLVRGNLVIKAQLKALADIAIFYRSLVELLSHSGKARDSRFLAH